MRYFMLSIAGSVLLTFSSCKDLKEPVFNGIQNVRVNTPKQGKSLMLLDVACFNPNNTGAKLKEADGDAWLDSTYLGHFTVDSTVRISANADFIVPVKLEVEMKHMLKHSLSALMNERVLITIKGKAKVGKKGFYRKIPLRYEGKQNLQELFK